VHPVTESQLRVVSVAGRGFAQFYRRAASRSFTSRFRVPDVVLNVGEAHDEFNRGADPRRSASDRSVTERTGSER
jgi:hypothetical protein